MQYGQVDFVIVGSDCIMWQGDVVNKIGIYFKVLVVKDNDVFFYVVFFFIIFDFEVVDGVQEILIEECLVEEVCYIQGMYNGKIFWVLFMFVDSLVVNYVFDVMLVWLVLGLIIEWGICEVIEDSIMCMFLEFSFLKIV